MTSSYKLPQSILNPIMQYLDLDLYSGATKGTRDSLKSVFEVHRKLTEDASESTDVRIKELSGFNKFIGLYHENLNYEFFQIERNVQEHILNSRNLIIQAAKGLKGRAIVFAPGMLEPLLELSKMFNELVLVGYDVQLLKDLKRRLPAGANVILHKADLTNGLVEKIANAFAIGAQSKCTIEETIEKITVIFKDFKPDLDFMSKLGPADFIVSSCITCELGRVVHQYIDIRSKELYGKTLGEAGVKLQSIGFGMSVQKQQEWFTKFDVAHDKLLISLPLQHIQDLKTLLKPMGRLYYADTTSSSQYDYNPKTQTRNFKAGPDWQKQITLLPKEIFSTVDTLFRTVIKRDWLWDFGPHGRFTDYPNTGVTNNVHARVLTLPKPIS